MGAAVSRLGPDLQALIAMMKNKYGLSYGDIQGLLDDGFGISVTRGGAAQVVLRVAKRSEPVYDRIRDFARRSDTVYPDDTGCKVGGRLQWMWVFVTGMVTLCVIRPSRGRDVPQKVLGAAYDGRMVHDGLVALRSFRAGNASAMPCTLAAASGCIAGVGHPRSGSLSTKGQAVAHRFPVSS